MPIDHAKKRLIIARLTLAITRAAARHYFPHMGLGTSQEFQTVALAVFIGHAEGRPKSAAGIARYIEMPRSTVLRKLDALIQGGMILKKGSKYCVNPDRVNGPGVAMLVRGNVRRVRAAANELSKLDS